MFSEDDILANVFDAKLRDLNDVFNAKVTVSDINTYVNILSEILKNNGQVYMYFNKPTFGNYYGEYYNRNIYSLMGSIFVIKPDKLDKHKEFLQELNDIKIEHFNNERNADYDILDSYELAKEIFLSVLNKRSDNLNAEMKKIKTMKPTNRVTHYAIGKANNGVNN